MENNRSKLVVLVVVKNLDWISFCIYKTKKPGSFESGFFLLKKNKKNMDEIRIKTLLEFLEFGIIDIETYENCISEMIK